MITKWSYEKIQKTVFQFSKKVEPVVDIIKLLLEEI